MIEKIGPTIYKGESIYKTVAGGSTGVLFYTWFDNVVNKIDTPIIGPEYSLDDDNAQISKATLTSEKFIGIKNFLKVQNKNNNNTPLYVQTPNINLNGLFSVNTLFCINGNKNDEPNFIWLYFNSFSIAIFLGKVPNGGFIDLWVSDDKTTQVFNNAYFNLNAYGYNQYRILEQIDLSKIRRIKIEYHELQKIVVSLDDIVYIQVLCDLPQNIYMRIDPRQNSNLYVSDIMIRSEP